MPGLSRKQSVSAIRRSDAAPAGRQLRCETFPEENGTAQRHRDFRNVLKLSGSPYKKMRPATAATSLERKIKSIRETVDVFCSPPGNDRKYSPNSKRQRLLKAETSAEPLVSASCTTSAAMAP